VPATHTVTTSDGRVLAAYEAGDPGGVPVFVHHGTPGSGLTFGPSAELAREQGIRLISHNRPGYGHSSRLPGRDIAAVVADIEAIADGLELERFVTWGISGGGPHALACAALCGTRLVAAASLAAPAPWEAEGLDWLAGMGESNVEEFDAVLAGEAALRPLLERDAHDLLEATPAQLAAVWETLLGPQDRAVLSGEFAGYIIDSGRVGVGGGIDGWLDDNLACVQPWGFELSAIDRPVLLLHGDDDRFVPVAHAHWLAARIPSVEARIRADDGHLTLLVQRVRETHEWLLAQL
jgi:pimeloyl-ACP methyl ester carboxylesterase